MLEFRKIGTEDLRRYARWFSVQNTHLSDYSVGFQFMWNRALAPEAAEYKNCLLLRGFFSGNCYFCFPLAPTEEEAWDAVGEIERFCRDSGVRLHFTNVPEGRVADMVRRYGNVELSNDRRWRDYLYPTEAFRTYAGGKYAGQRNHVNKFKKKYPNWEFRPAMSEDLPAITAFLREYEEVQRGKGHIADEEMKEVYHLLPYIHALDLLAGVLLVDQKIVAFTIGERCGDMVVVHVEKALRAYEGAYPMIASQFAQMFCGSDLWLNRMDDAGDLGLRKSKMQYLPAEIVGKFNVIPRRAIDLMHELPTLRGPRIRIAPLREEDAEAYARLAGDIERNRYWGYDWRENFSSPPDFLELAREDFRHRREAAMGIFTEEGFAGETVLHRFGYAHQAEVGVRLLPEAEGKGYAREAVKTVTDWAFSHLGLERMEAKCFRENLRSKAMLLGAGMLPCGEDETFFYFYRTAES